ncbi:GerW family sporulation protein [Streptomyces rhizosphaericus]|uniref:GerW family sporulation protein n=1 Tax=Streptomyces rhizosphaericus TaxID=114699 RepID=UPI000A3AE65C|nr:hypothetical protein [Streptomyces rhizosphaericus]
MSLRIVNTSFPSRSRLAADSPSENRKGDPVTRGEVTVIPVAEAGFGGGARREVGTAKTGEGGGGARPCGFIEIKDGTVTYKPLRDLWADVVIQLAAPLVGAALPRLARRLTARRMRSADRLRQ